MILRADKYLCRRINKFLSGVPPPPGYTISQKSCDDFLTSLKQNRNYFWADPFDFKETQSQTVDEYAMSDVTQVRFSLTTNVNSTIL